MLRKLIVGVAVVALGAVMTVGVQGSTTITTKASAATSPPPQQVTVPNGVLKKGLEVVQDTMVLDDAGARCASSTDVSKCAGQQLYPVDPPRGRAVYHTEYGPNDFGQLAVTATDNPAILVGELMHDPQKPVDVGGVGKGMPDHEFYATTGWNHFPCFCNYGKILQSIHVKALEVCVIASNCPVFLGSGPGGALTAYSPEYLQQIYGLFSQGFRVVQEYATGFYVYGYNPGTYSFETPLLWYYDAGTGVPNSGYRMNQGVLMGLYGCGGAGGIGWVGYSADQQFTYNGDYTEAGWIDGIPGSCVTFSPSILNDTHMA